MTLIITEFSPYGIAMVAESAMTSSFNLRSGVQSQVLIGCLKLQQIPYLEAGLSMWGLGKMPITGDEIPTDVWVADFIKSHTHLASLDEFAENLVENLQSTLGHCEDPIGFHLAGYSEISMEKKPQLFHVRNNDGLYGQESIHEFIKGEHQLPADLNRIPYPQIRNGDYGLYANLFENVERNMPSVVRRLNLGIDIPHKSLDGRLSYLSSWIRFLSDLYASSGELRSIGSNVITLGIAPEGRIRAYQM